VFEVCPASPPNPVNDCRGGRLPKGHRGRSSSGTTSPNKHKQPWPGQRASSRRLLQQPIADAAGGTRGHPPASSPEGQLPQRDREDTPEEPAPPPCPAKPPPHHDGGSGHLCSGGDAWPRGGRWHGRAAPRPPLSPAACRTCLLRQAWHGAGHAPDARVPYKERNAGTGHAPLRPPDHRPGSTPANSRPLPDPAAPGQRLQLGPRLGLAPGVVGSSAPRLVRDPIPLGDPEGGGEGTDEPSRVRQLVTHCELPLPPSALTTGRQPPSSRTLDFQGPVWRGWPLRRGRDPQSPTALDQLLWESTSNPISAAPRLG